jgi:CO dehydrogenase/acetyl-CoA synthase delta subunit
MSKNRIAELDKCHKELKRRECDYGTSDRARRGFEIAIENYYVKIGKIFAVALKADQCHVNTKTIIDQNYTTFDLSLPTKLIFKTTIFNKQNPNQKDYSVVIRIDRPRILAADDVSKYQPPEITLDRHKTDTEIGDYPYEEALIAFKKGFPKFEKAFYRSIDKKIKRLKREIKRSKYQ